MKLSIGITTYNRNDFLKNCLQTIFQQGQHNIEVLVGNDYVASPITEKDLGVSDPRLQILNYEKNLGELSNLNHLLKVATGDYFIWMADDDEFNIGSLDLLFKAGRKHPQLDFIIPKCHSGTQFPETNPSACREVFLKRNDFLKKYITSEVSLQGVYILYKTEYLRKIGGIQKLGTGHGFYADSHLTFRTVIDSDEVCYLTYPCTMFRIHDQSLSNTSADLEALFSAQKEFTGDFMMKWSKKEDFAAKEILTSLFQKWFIPYYVDVSIRSQNHSLKNTLRFVPTLFQARHVLGASSLARLLVLYSSQAMKIYKAALKAQFHKIGLKK